MELTISTIMLKLNKLRVVSPHDFSVSPSPLGFELGLTGLGLGLGGLGTKGLGPGLDNKIFN